VRTSCRLRWAAAETWDTVRRDTWDREAVKGCLRSTRVSLLSPETLNCLAACTYRQTDRQTERQADRQTDGETDIYKERERERDREGERQTDGDR